MKRFVVSISILLGVLFLLAQAFAAAENKESERIGTGRTTRYSRPRVRRSRTDANSLDAELKFLADANAIRSKLKEFEGLEKELEKVNKEGGREIREWVRGPAKERMRLAKVMQKQVSAELVLARKLAVEEGALKTKAAIEALLLDRQERFEKMFKKMEAEMRKMRRGDRGYRRDRGRFRNTRDRYEDTYREEDTYRDRDRNRYRDRDRDSYRDRELEDRRSR